MENEIVIKDSAEERALIKEEYFSLLERISQMGNTVSPKDQTLENKALRMIQLKAIIETAEKSFDILKKELAEDENFSTQFFWDYERKVILSEGRASSRINPITVFENLKIEDFLKVASVTEKAIKDNPVEYISAAELIGKSKEPLPSGNPYITVSKTTKKDLEENKK